MSFLRFSVLCLAALVLPISGCSKGKEKEPEVEKKVVQDLQVVVPEEDKAENPAANKDEVETLPLDSDQ